jgi:ubiquinone/menaquinone biosynthesis C-methylase UbiE
LFSNISIVDQNPLPTMTTARFSAISFAFLLAASAGNGVVGFRAGAEGNRALVKKAVDDLLGEVKPVPSVAEEVAPPLRTWIPGADAPAHVEYWSRPDIHTFGNMGLGGAFHAALAPLATKIIDWKAYDGVDVRKSISRELRTLFGTGARVVDLCCGVGMSTRALEAEFFDAEFVVGVDTSSEMLSMARAISSHEQGVRRFDEAIQKVMHGVSNATVRASYQLGNAENTSLCDPKVDLVTIMFAFHEVPMHARARILREARRLLRRGGALAVVDICPTYQPSPYMLAGEPFVKEYQRNIHRQLETAPGFAFWKREFVVPGHVHLSLLVAG